MPSREEDLEHLNQPLAQREKMKNDAVAYLSDQLMTITEDCRNLREDNNSIGTLWLK
jgi:uncharacterized protein YacL